eukprot:13153447-Alexandrium_andersonii.AAC.1
MPRPTTSGCAPARSNRGSTSRRLGYVSGLAGVREAAARPCTGRAGPTAGNRSARIKARTDRAAAARYEQHPQYIGL